MSNMWDSRFLSKSTGSLRQTGKKADYFADSTLSSTRSYGKNSVTMFNRRGSGASDSSMPSSDTAKSNTTTRHPSIRSRASSAASSGLDSSQVHLLLNKRDSRSSIFASNSFDPQSPTSVYSLNSTTNSTLRGSLHEDGFEYMRRLGDTTRDQLPPPTRKISGERAPPRKNIITVMPRNDKPPVPITSPGTVYSQQAKASAHPSEEVPRPLERIATEPNLSMTTTMYLNEIIWQIDDLVYVGGIEASCNMNLLCRLNVTFFLDLTDDPDRKDNKTPCLCSTPSRHSRYMVDIQLPKENAAYWLDANGQQVSMTDLYERFVSLTEKATKAGRKVLVFSNKGRNKAPAFAAAYLMHRHKISRATAVGRVQRAMESMRPAVNISDYLQRSLMRYQAHKNIEVDSAYDSSHSTSIFRVPRTAWI